MVEDLRRDPHATEADPDAVADLSTSRRVHIVGIGGAAMRAIASVLVAMGHQVSGSDQRSSVALDALSAEGVEVFVGHLASNVPEGTDLVAISTAIPAANPELLEARQRRLPVCSREAMMVAILKGRDGVAVAGTHGKTTTSSMLALVLREAGLDPSFIIGGDLAGVGPGASWGTGELFVVEADESDGSFLAIPRQAGIVTSVEPDHLDHYGGTVELEDAFRSFLAQTPGLRLVCADDEVAARLGREIDARSYGTAEGADYQVVDVRPGRDGIGFSVIHARGHIAEIRLPLPGLHNARNACAALAAGLELGAPVDAAVRALEGFEGVARRFEHRGEGGGVTFIDDYGHLPGEVRAMLDAALDGGWQRIVVVFQPHRYSRTGLLWRDFADAFEGAGLVVVTDIYNAGESPRQGVTGELILRSVVGAHPEQRSIYLPDRDELRRFLLNELRPGDLCLTLGAGDLTGLPDELLAELGPR